MDLLKKTLTTTAVVALATGIIFGATSAKAETAGTSITATVANAFTLVETTPLAFGSLVAINHAVDTSTLVIDTAGIHTYNNPGNARLVQVTAGTQGVFDITGAAPTTALVLTMPAPVTLNCGTCGAGTEDFTVNTFTDNVAGAPTTDGAGAVTFNVGATLNTIASANAYNDGPYSGLYTITVNY
jgi:hypothetical protein